MDSNESGFIVCFVIFFMRVEARKKRKFRRFHEAVARYRAHYLKSNIIPIFEQILAEMHCVLGDFRAPSIRSFFS